MSSVFAFIVRIEYIFMISIQFDRPSFAVGTTVTGRIVVNRSSGEKIGIELFNLTLTHVTEITDNKGQKVWQNELLAMVVEVSPPSLFAAEAPFNFTPMEYLQYSSEGEADGIRVRIRSIVTVSAVTRGEVGQAPEASEEIILAPREDEEPVKDVEVVRLPGGCCSSGGRVSIIVSIPSTILRRKDRVIPITVDVGQGGGRRPVKAAAFLTYHLSHEKVFVLSEAGRSDEISFERRNSVILPLEIAAQSGWQGLLPFPGTPHVAALLSVLVWFGDADPIVRTLTVNVV